MSSLFWIGNGFDKAHGFKTGFDDFKDWLQSEYGAGFLDELNEIPDYSTNYKGMNSYDDSKMAQFFYNLLYEIFGDNWNEFESGLAKINWYKCINDSMDELMWFDLEDRQLILAAEEFANNLREMAYVLTESLFNSWICGIDIDKPNNISQELKELIGNNESHFLSFNYTDTLEKHYGVDNVCHIHGRGSIYDKLIVGHSEKKMPFKEAEEWYMLEVDPYINSIHMAYRKDTDNIFNNNKVFFEKLMDIADVYIHGFSFSDVDLYYLKKLFEYINPNNVVFHLHSYDEANRQSYIQILTDYGALPEKILPFRLKELDDTKP